MAHQQLSAVRRQREILDAVERGQLAHRAAAERRPRRPRSRRAARGCRRSRSGVPSADSCGCETSHLPEVSWRGLPPSHRRTAATSRDCSDRNHSVLSVRHPAEIVEVPVDPGVVVQVVARLQRRLRGVDGRDPAILVVDRAHQHRDVAAVVAPVDRRAVAVAIGLDAHVAIALQRILAGGLAQRGERIVADAGQRVELQLAWPCPRRRRPATACAAAAHCGRRSVRASSISS